MKNYILYEDVLTDDEILLYGQMIDKFKTGEIDFKTLESMFLSLGITIETTLFDFSKTMMSIEEANIVRERISKQDYLYSDIHYFILNSNRFKNVIFCIDYKAIEVLANAGMPKYQNTLISILKTQLRYSDDKDKTLVKKRENWKTRIAELESQLANSNKFGKTI